VNEIYLLVKFHIFLKDQVPLYVKKKRPVSVIKFDRGKLAKVIAQEDLSVQLLDFIF